MKSVLELSKRTVSKLLKRAKRKCSICGWDDASIDIHHIIEFANGGTDDMDNLVTVCPNCHRKIHEHGSGFKSVSDLKEMSLDKTFPDWEKYYKLCNCKKVVNKIRNKKCKVCGEQIYNTRTFCSTKCAGKEARIINWDEVDLEKLLYENNNNFSKVGRVLGISDNAVRKRYKKINGSAA